MAPNRGRNRTSDFEDLVDSAPIDFDPEADDIEGASSDSDASLDDETTVDDSREHYVNVGKGKLRKQKDAALGPQYRGSSIRRDAFSEDEDDPFSRGFEDVESDEGGDLGVHNRSSAEDEDASEDFEGRHGGKSDTEVSDEEDEVAKPTVRTAESAFSRDQLLKAVARDQKAVASSLAQSTKADAEKGRAVKKQRAAFDSLLNARIRMQKTLIGANTIVGTASDTIDAQMEEGKDALQAAETAAFNLWSSLNGLREELIEARTGEKRKRKQFSTSTPAEDLWARVQAQEESALPHRNATLQRWSRKARGVTALPQQGLLSKGDNQTSLVDTLKGYLAEPERLSKRAHIPRSCAPLQLANKVVEDGKIYDDADFYGLLLKELLDQKNQDSGAASNIDLNVNVRREAKTKKNVDTKASKGRKLRYTVHEKLQNFMAPEDRSTWGERRTDELFGSLFGQTLGLGEEKEDDDENMRGDDDFDVEEAALTLFRS